MSSALLPSTISQKVGNLHDYEEIVHSIPFS
jgi:hypothetical protein